MGKELLLFISSLVISAFVHFILIRVSHKRGLFIDDHESELPQKLHDTPTPRIGGLGIFLASIIFTIDNKLGLIILGCSIPAFLSGLFEDLFSNIAPKIRLLIMIASAILAIIIAKAVVTDFGSFSTPYWAGVIISFIAILGLINGTNLIDGFNGLLSGTCTIIFGAFAFICYKVGNFDLMIVNLVLVGALLGFMLFNYPKGLIFMGDGGAYFLGFIMAVIAMRIANDNPSINPFFVFVCILYPVFEVIFSFIRRGIINRTNPMEPDDKHLHTYINRSVVNGQNSKTIWVILPFILVFNLLAIKFYNNQSVLILLSLIFMLIYVFAYLYLDKKPSSKPNDIVSS